MPSDDPLAKLRYHQGDLYEWLLQAATLRLREAGVDGLRVGKLADRVNVSRTALYPHFRDQQRLKGSGDYSLVIDTLLADPGSDGAQRLYLKFTLDNPELYSLRFGQSLWQPSLYHEGLRT